MERDERGELRAARPASPSPRLAVARDEDERQMVMLMSESSAHLWGAGDVARYLGVSLVWVRRATAKGTLPSGKFGGLRRYEPSAIMAWAAAQMTRKGA